MTSAGGDGGVQTLYSDYVALNSELSAAPSGLAALNRSFHKHLLLAAASNLEDRVKRRVAEIFELHGTDRLAAFVSKRVMARGYHGLFEWNSGKAQGFFTSFGEACGQAFKTELRANSDLRENHDAFMRLGQLRNLLVHNDYASATIELTPEEIMGMYQNALHFVDRIEDFVLADQ